MHDFPRPPWTEPAWINYSNYLLKAKYYTSTVATMPTHVRHVVQGWWLLAFKKSQKAPFVGLKAVALLSTKQSGIFFDFGLLLSLFLRFCFVSPCWVWRAKQPYFQDLQLCRSCPLPSVQVGGVCPLSIHQLSHKPSPSPFPPGIGCISLLSGRLCWCLCHYLD